MRVGCSLRLHMRRDPTRNVCQLGLGFFTLFVAFNSQGYIQEALFESVSREKEVNGHAGYYGLATYYGVFTLANLVIAPIIDWLGPRWAMTLGALLTTVYQAGFIHLNEPFFYFSSALAGLGAALLWPSQGNYMTANSDDSNIEKNSSILWAMSQASQIAGGIVLLAIFYWAPSQDGSSISIPASQGAAVCFTALLLLSIVVFATLPSVQTSLAKESRERVVDQLVSSVRLLKTKRMVLLATVFSYTGIVQSFWTSIYPTCISFTLRQAENTNYLVALSSIASGLGQVTLCFWVASGGARLSRRSLVLIGCLIHLVVFLGVIINFPSDASLKRTQGTGYIEPNMYLALILSFLLGFGDGCWNTQVYALIADVYPHCSSQAFAVFNFYQSLFTAVSLFYSTQFLLPVVLGILAGTAVLAAVCYWRVDQMGRLEYESPASLKEKEAVLSAADELASLGA